MPSKYKNAPKEVIREAIADYAKANYPFQQPVLQRDTFWIYCNARRYWGRYTDALKDANVELSSAFSVKSEFGYEIDWWHFQESQVQKECLGMLVDHLYKEGVDISPKGLKQSKYFDLYTDAVLLFGNYETLLKYVDIPEEEVRPHTSSGNNIDSVIEPVISLYTSDCRDHGEKCRRIAEAGLRNIDVDITPLTKELRLYPVIVDGANGLHPYDWTDEARRVWRFPSLF